MDGKRTVLYIHGMGGGGDSRIPALLREFFSHMGGATVDVVVRTYDFDPERGREQILGWMEELKPSLVIGESLGSIQAIRIKGVPHILVSPSLGAPARLSAMAPLMLLPGGPAIAGRIWHPREGDRQKLEFRFGILRKYRAHGKAALAGSPREGGRDYFHAFFGTKDHYRRTGVVSISLWKKYFGSNTFTIYEGTHFMEEEHVRNLLVPKIMEVLGL